MSNERWRHYKLFSIPAVKVTIASQQSQRQSLMSCTTVMTACYSDTLLNTSVVAVSSVFGPIALCMQQASHLAFRRGCASWRDVLPLLLFDALLTCLHPIITSNSQHSDCLCQQTTTPATKSKLHSSNGLSESTKQDSMACCQDQRVGSSVSTACVTDAHALYL